MKWTWYEVLITFSGLVITVGTVKVPLVRAMKAYGGSGAVPPLILNFGTCWV